MAVYQKPVEQRENKKVMVRSREITDLRKLKLQVSPHTIIIGMNWVFIAIAVLLFVTWIVFRVVLAFPLGVLNMLWMLAILFLVLSGVHSLEG